MLSRLSIKQKLILIMLIPLLVVILLAAKLAIDSFSTSKNLRALDEVVILSTKIGALVHETQKERGMTAGFIGSMGQKFKTELPLVKLADFGYSRIIGEHSFRKTRVGTVENEFNRQSNEISRFLIFLF